MLSEARGATKWVVRYYAHSAHPPKLSIVGLVHDGQHFPIWLTTMVEYEIQRVYRGTPKRELADEDVYS